MRPKPIDALGAMQRTRAAVLMAVITQDRPTVRSVMEAAGLESTSTAYQHLKTLRQAGLVEWEPRRKGTLRSTLTVVAIDRSLLRWGGTTQNSSRTPAA